MLLLLSFGELLRERVLNGRRINAQGAEVSVVQGAFRAHSGNIESTFRKHSER
jgi:hypothetical protein